MINQIPTKAEKIRQKALFQGIQPSERADRRILLSIYKYVYRCTKCTNIYGSDFPNDNKVCMACEKEQKSKSMKRVWNLK